MEEMTHGKILWTDDPPRNPAWKTALLLFVAIFTMNFAYGQEIVYLALALISVGFYLYFSFKPDGLSSKIRIYEDGILAVVRTGGSRLSFPVESFFRWNEVKTLKVETGRFISKQNKLRIETRSLNYTAKLENKEGFVFACKKLKKEVVA